MTRPGFGLRGLRGVFNLRADRSEPRKGDCENTKPGIFSKCYNPVSVSERNSSAGEQDLLIQHTVLDGTNRSEGFSILGEGDNIPCQMLSCRGITRELSEPGGLRFGYAPEVDLKKEPEITEIRRSDSDPHKQVN